jgi:RNA 3'-terminal phosphate cyclase (GTP)
VDILIEIDGNYCEGGGQILRTAIALAGVTGREIEIANIRAKRDPPGLKNQHLAGVLAAGQLCNASVEGAAVGSERIVFRPGEVTSGGYTVNIGTAGSVTLLLQMLIPIAVHADAKVILRVTGGTNVRWSPSIEYFSEVFLYFLRKMGIHITLESIRYGFYPKGGGKVKVTVWPWEEKNEIEITERGEEKGIKAISIATTHLTNAHVAERQAKAFRRVLPCKKEVAYVDSYSIGSSITGVAYYDHTRLGSCSLGVKGKRAEIVGQEAAKGLRKERRSGAAFDTYMGDQIIPYLGMAGGKITVSAITDHLKTNCWVTEQVLPVNITAEGHTVEAVRRE